MENQWTSFFFMAVLIILFFLWKRFQRSSAKEVKLKLESGAQVIDVRSQAEFQNGHFPGALNIPVQNLLEMQDRLGPKDKPLVLYCASGNRSGVAKTMLKRSGFLDIINAGGLSRMMLHK